ncbi:MAG: hypothetical protein KDC98_14725 [Planctomycetes bacterium]|nr:hypothetical protein [Planctomycetota bacterium]
MATATAQSLLTPMAPVTPPTASCVFCTLTGISNPGIAIDTIDLELAPAFSSGTVDVFLKSGGVWYDYSMGNPVTAAVGRTPVPLSRPIYLGFSCTLDVAICVSGPLSHNYTGGPGLPVVGADMIFTPVGAASTVNGLPVPGTLSATFRYTIGPAGCPNVATVTEVGSGCHAEYESFYEWFTGTGAGAFDLSGLEVVGTSLSGAAGGPYVITVGPVPNLAVFNTGAFLASSTGVITITPPANGELYVAHSTPTFFDGDPSRGLGVGEDCWISPHQSFAGGAPSVATFLAGGSGGISVYSAWSDVTGGNIYYEDQGTAGYDCRVLYKNVREDAIGGAGPFNVAFTINKSSGSFKIAFSANNLRNNPCLVGYSGGGPNVDPGSMDLSNLWLYNTSHTTDVADVLPLRLSTIERPWQGPNVFHATTDNIVPGSSFHFGLVGLNSIVPTPLQLFVPSYPDCMLYCNPMVVTAGFAPRTSETWTVASFPAGFAYWGLPFCVQAVTIDPNGKWRSSNELRCVVGAM